MPYAIIARDKPGALDKRMEHRPAHVEYLKSKMDLILCGGATLGGADESMDGSLLILDTEDRAVAEDFAKNDPFALNGVFETVTVMPWRKTIWDKALQG
ncbi:YciI family protein [Nisaea sediminum]|uniref:YciI family protein n=1 Tax=Nisaea sediminum TaxID=2775867 RepID=UPI0018693BA6|nr:YciI family protein [Nisaea sediminum]